MFRVRGVNGDVFRGPMEQLLLTHRVEAPTPARAIEQDAGELRLPGATTAPPEDRRPHAAVAAYAAADHPAPERGPVYHVYQVMTTHVLVLAPETGVAAAWRSLADRGVGQAPVVSRDGDIVGLATRANLLTVLNEEDGRLRDVMMRTVEQVMTTPVVTVEPTADVRRVARVLLDYHLPALPVVDAHGVLIGIVTRSDVLKCVISDPPLTLWA